MWLFIHSPVSLILCIEEATMRIHLFVFVFSIEGQYYILVSRKGQ